MKDGDLSNLLPEEIDGSDAEVIIGLNKIDLLDKNSPNLSILHNGNNVLPLSVKNGVGIEKLRQTIHNIAAKDDLSAVAETDVMVTNLRQADALRQALEALEPLIDGLQSGLETDLAAQHLRETLSHLASITGEIPSTEILNTIFKSFCVGK